MSMRFYKAKSNRNSSYGVERFERQLKNCESTELRDDDNFYIQLFKQLHLVDGEEKVILIQKLYSQMERENKIKYAVKHRLLSITLEETLSLAPASIVASVMKVFSEEMRILCSDPHASRVLQALLSLSFKHSQERLKSQEENCDGESLSNVQQNDIFTPFILSISKFVFNNLHEFVSAAYASHIVCLVLQICSGVQVPESVTCSTRYFPYYSISENTNTQLEVSEEFVNLFNKVVLRLTQLPEFTDVISSHSGSAVLQTALFIVSLSGNAELCETLVCHILQHGFKALDSSPPDQKQSLHPVFENNAACRLFELVLSTATKEQQLEIFEFYFQHQMSELIQHSFGNFTVQRLLESWKSKKSFSKLFSAVSENLVEAAKSGHSGVILSFVKACRTHGLEVKCKKQLRKLYGCEDEESVQKLSLLLLYFVTYEDFQTLKQCNSLPYFSQHGSLIIQELLQFKNPRKIVESILATPCSELMNIACNALGSHIFDMFTKGPSIDLDSKERLIAKFEGNFCNLACDKHGSRSLEALWSAAQVNDKEKICKELSEKSSKLTDNHFGKIIYHKFKINLFKNGSKKGWTKHQNKGLAKRTLATNMLEETDVTEPAKKKRKNKNKFSYQKNK